MHEPFTVVRGPETGNTAVLRLTGPLDAKTAPGLIEHCAAVHEGGQNLVLNLEGVTFIASSGIGALLSLAESFREDERRLGFAAVSPAVESVLALLNLEEFLTVYTSEDEALEALEKREAA